MDRKRIAIIEVDFFFQLNKNIVLDIYINISINRTKGECLMC